MPLVGWLFRVRPYAGGRFAIGCARLVWVRLEGRPLHNPPRIALAETSNQSACGFMDYLRVGADRCVRPLISKPTWRKRNLCRGELPRPPVIWTITTRFLRYVTPKNLLFCIALVTNTRKCVQLS